MATLLELRGLFSDGELMSKVESALIIAANNLISGTPTVQDKKWSAHVLGAPRPEGRKALMVVLAENSGISTAAIQSASDASIQAAVDGVAQILSDAYGA